MQEEASQAKQAQFYIVEPSDDDAAYRVIYNCIQAGTYKIRTPVLITRDQCGSKGKKRKTVSLVTI